MGNGDGITDVTGATVKIAGAKIKGTFNPSSAAFTITSGTTPETDISDVTMNSAITSDKYIAVIPPQKFSSGTAFLQVTIGDATYTYKPASEITLDAKKSLLLQNHSESDRLDCNFKNYGLDKWWL